MTNVSPFYFHQVQTWWSVMKVTFWRTRHLLCQKRWTLSGRGGGLCWLEHLCKTTLLNVRLPGCIDTIRLCVVVNICNICDLCLCTRPLHGELHQGKPAGFNKRVQEPLHQPYPERPVCWLHISGCPDHEEEGAHPLWDACWLCPGKKKKNGQNYSQVLFGLLLVSS